MLKKHYKLLLKCALVLPFICLLETLGVITHLFEKDFDRYFHYPLQKGDSNIYQTVTFEVNAGFNYSFIHKPTIDSKTSTKLAVIIKSAVGNVDRRTSIRNTWGFEKRFSDVLMKRAFLIGEHPHTDSMELIAKEAKYFNDIVQLNFHDAYFNNTIKTMTGIRWAYEQFNNSDYYLFVDDDYYVSIKNLLRFVGNKNKVYDIDKEAEQNILFGGYVMQTSPLRHKWSKWYISLEEYPFDMWPPYVTAGAYILSREALHKLYTASQMLPLFRFDDIYLGIVALKAGLKLNHCNNFHFHRPRYTGPDSYQNVIASHGFDDPSEMERIWTDCRSAGYA